MRQSPATTPTEPGAAEPDPLAAAGARAKRPSGPSQGFTLMEMIVILAVLVLVAGLVMPNVAALERGRQTAALEGQIYRLPAEARDEAVKLQEPVALIIQGNQLELEEMPPQTTLSVNSTQTQDTGPPVVLRQVDMGSSISVTSVETGGQSADMGTWQWTAYPDGSADDGGIQFQDGSGACSLVLLPNSPAEWIKGPLPDLPTSWTAGTFSPTVQSTQQ